ncbi:hypothetical protein EXS54_02180 [Patescibacteria group bacterium]|nr:hypothetical protein [Patescibacteria group bacterium]
MVNTMSNQRYAAVLGRNPALSIAELHALKENPQPLNDAAVFIEGINPKPLGGTLKVVELLNRTLSTAEDMIDALVDATSSDQKLRFGISIYGKADVGGLLMRSKRRLKTISISSGFVQSTEPLNLAQVKHNDLISKGAEWCLFETNDGWRGGKTTWIPDFEGFSVRDYDKPKSDSKRGMLPPQLARAMVNIATKNEPTAVYDPFCGVGGLLLESAALDHPTYGSDVDPKAISDAKKNLEWLGKRSGLPKWNVSVHDATQPLPISEPAVIATEGYLGELVAPNTNDEVVERTIAEVEPIMLKFFETARNFLKLGQRLVITLPAWKLKNEIRRLTLVDRVLALGYTVIRPVPEGLALTELNRRNSIDVARPKQRVIHELIILERT